MPQPSVQQVHYDVPLSNLLLAYMQDDSNFVATQVFPTVPVQHRSDVFWQYNRDAFFRSDAAERAIGAESEGTGYSIDATPTYLCREYSVHHDIPYQIRANADGMLNLDRDATELVGKQLLIKRENIWTSNFYTTGLWGTDLTGTAGSPDSSHVKQWDQAGSTPIEDVNLQIVKIAEQTALRPNTLVISPYVWNVLRNNSELIDRIKYTQAGFPDTALMAKAFGVDRVLIPFATQNTAQEGTTRSMSYIYGKNALLVYAAPNPGLMQVSGGYTFSWAGYLNGDASAAISRFDMPWKKVQRVEGEMALDMKLVAADVGTFFSNVVS